MNKNILTYKKSGVDINAADKFVKYISNISTRKKGKKKLNNIGGFGSITDIPRNLKNPKIVACDESRSNGYFHTSLAQLSIFSRERLTCTADKKKAGK